MEFLSIFLNKKENTPLYYQLYSGLKKYIQEGTLQANEKLPSKRMAAQQWGVSVNTVDEAYQMLVVEGYVNTYPRSGFIVNKMESSFQLEQKKETKPINKKENSKWIYNFASGASDPAFFPAKTWNRLFREVLVEEPELFEHGEPLGDEILRQEIAKYLTSYRAVNCMPEQIVVGAGLEVLLTFLAELWKEKTVAVEDPGYKKIVHIFQNAGAKIEAIPIDEEGMQLNLLIQSKADIAYLTPSHQFPTGGVMPINRRVQMLQWAQNQNKILIEDDYDSEYRFDGKPLPSLQGLDDGNHVVYAGTFSRSLAPSLRIAYLVLPHWILEKWKIQFHDYACTVSRIEQHTLARFMKNGNFYRGLNQRRNQYKKRRNEVLKEIETQFYGINYTIKNKHTGLYFLLELKDGNAKKIAEKAKENQMNIKSLEEYAENRISKKKAEHTLIIGYGGLPEKSIKYAVENLRKIIL